MARMILSIDGGGVRAYYFASFLKQVENQLKYPIVECFDRFVGNSAGGLVALALAHGMPLSELRDRARVTLPKVFSRGWMEKISNPGGLRRPLYDNRELIALFDRIFGSTKMRDLHKDCMVTALEIAPEAALWGRKAWATQLINAFMDSGMDTVDYSLEIVAKYGLISFHRATPPEHRGTTLIRSWSEKTGDWLVKDAAQATSAAPTFLPGLVRGKAAYVDGGLYANNPAMIAAISVLDDFDFSVTPYLFSVGSPEFEQGMDDASDESFAAMDEALEANHHIVDRMVRDLAAALSNN